MSATPTKFKYTRELKSVPLSRVDEASFNPPDRVANIDDLLESMATDGQLDPVHLVLMPDGRLQLADGHRRAAALAKLGKTSVLAFVYEGGANETTANEIRDRLFVELQGAKRTMKNSTMTQAHLHGGPAANSMVKNCVGEANRIFNDTIPNNVKEALCPYFLSVGRRTAKYCNPGVPPKGDAFDRFLGKVLCWLARNETQQVTIAYMRNKWSAQRLKTAIERGDTTAPGMLN